jgi:hypothetical protein
LTLTSFIQDRNNTGLPSSFAHLPGVEYHFGLLREYTEATFIGYTPIVPEEDKNLWITYTKENAEKWLFEEPQEVHREEVTGYGDQDDDHHGRKLEKDVQSITPYIWKYVVDDDKGNEIVFDQLTCQARGEIDHDDIIRVVETESPSSPLWYYSPPLKATGINAVNFNVRSETDIREAFELVEATQLPTFRDICPFAAWFPVCTGQYY